MAKIKIGRVYRWKQVKPGGTVVCVTKESTEKFGPLDIINGYVYYLLDEPNQERFLWRQTAQNEWELIDDFI